MDQLLEACVMNNTIAVGIPFMASQYTKALELCLLSIKRYLPEATEVFLQLDVTNESLRDSFHPEPILKILPQIRIRRYTRSRSGDYKQALIEWVLSETRAAYAIFMHSDVFFWKSGIYQLMIEPLISQTEQMFCCWKTSFVEYSSTFHKSRESAKNFWVAPRIATWLFSVNVGAFRDSGVDYSLLWKGHYWIRCGILSDIPVDADSFMVWLNTHCIDDTILSGRKDCLIDIGTFFRMKWDQGMLRGVCLGTLDNPSFSSMDFIYHKEGFVHIEQYDPERFNNQFYSQQTFVARTKLIEDILYKEYGVEQQ